MGKLNRTCHVCGERYYFCTSSNCDASRGNPLWMVMFDCENCKNIWEAISDHFYKKLTDKEAIQKLGQCDLSKRNSFNFSADVNKDLEMLLGKNTAIPEKAKSNK